MADRPFVDYYEILQVGQNADLETIERVFRLLAKRYHPDNSESGNDERFREIHDAFEVLADPELRAEYDVQYDRNKSLQWSIFEQGSAIGGQEEDRRIFRGDLALLYDARRNNPPTGGHAAVDLERMLGVPREHLEFPNWYLKKKGWVEVLDSGQFAITVEGIDKVSSEELSVPDNRLLSELFEEAPEEATGEAPEEAPEV